MNIYLSTAVDEMCSSVLYNSTAWKMDPRFPKRKHIETSKVTGHSVITWQQQCLTRSWMSLPPSWVSFSLQCAMRC